MKRLNEIENIIGYAFKDKTLLERAFVHSSYANEHGVQSYERLEFLGDGVLGLIVTECLYQTNDDEGAMTEKRARIVSSAPLENATEKLGLWKYMQFGEGESKQPHKRRKMLADLFESIVGALYLDGGFDCAKAFVFAALGDLIEQTSVSNSSTNSKGDLQEYCQCKKLGSVEYVVLERGGQPHEPHFVVEARIGGKGYAQGSGSRIKDAERDAAKNALEILRK